MYTDEFAKRLIPILERESGIVLGEQTVERVVRQALRDDIVLFSRVLPVSMKWFINRRRVEEFEYYVNCATLYCDSKITSQSPDECLAQMEKDGWGVYDRQLLCGRCLEYG